MIDYKNLKLKSNKYINIFIVEDRNYWSICSYKCNKETDLVLCIDFALNVSQKSALSPSIEMRMT